MDSQIKGVTIGQNQFCGPAVLSIITGKSTDECARVISSINGKYNITGVTSAHLLQAANLLGFDHEEVPIGNTLFGTMNMLSKRDGIYVVVVANHYVVIEVQDKKVWFCDNHTKEPMPAAASARMMQRCAAAYRMEKRRDPILVNSRVFVEVHKSNGRFIVTLKDEVTYDIEKYNRVNVITKFGLDDMDRLMQFINSIKEQAEKLL